MKQHRIWGWGWFRPYWCHLYDDEYGCVQCPEGTCESNGKPAVEPAEQPDPPKLKPHMHPKPFGDKEPE